MKKTVKIEFLESKIVDLKCDIVTLEKKYQNETKILSEQVSQMTNLIFKISKQVWNARAWEDKQQQKAKPQSLSYIKMSMTQTIP